MNRTNRTYSPKHRRQDQGFNASLMQVTRAYEAHFAQRIPSGMTYAAAAQEVVDALGIAAGREFILAQVNDASVPYLSDSWS